MFPVVEGPIGNLFTENHGRFALMFPMNSSGMFSKKKMNDVKEQSSSSKSGDTITRLNFAQVAISQLRALLPLPSAFVVLTCFREGGKGKHLQMAASEERFTRDVEQSNLSTSGGFFGQYVSELIVSVIIFHLDQWVKIDPVEQPIKCNTVSA